MLDIKHSLHEHPLRLEVKPKRWFTIMKKTGHIEPPAFSYSVAPLSKLGVASSESEMVNGM